MPGKDGFTTDAVDLELRAAGLVDDFAALVGHLHAEGSRAVDLLFSLRDAHARAIVAQAIVSTQLEEPEILRVATEPTGVRAGSDRSLLFRLMLAYEAEAERREGDDA